MHNAAPAKTMTRPNNHLYMFLDALRGVAAVLVAQRHISETFGGQPFQSSYLAVDFFFALSGFVIAHAYNGRLANGMSERSFLWRRLVRLYPMFIMGLVLRTGYDLGRLQAVDGATLLSWGVTFLFNALFLPISLLDQPFILGPAWSLFCEVLANILYGRLASTGITWRKTLPPLLIGALLMLLFLWKFGNLDIGWFFASLAGGPARVLYSFFAGVLIYSQRSRIPSGGMGIGLLCCAALVAALCLDVSPGARVYYDAIVALAILPLIVAAGAGVILPRIFSNMCRFLGASSYPMYVLHLPMAAIFFWLFSSFFGTATQSEISVAVWLFITALAILSWALEVYVDEPLRKKILGRQIVATTLFETSGNNPPPRI